MVVSTRLNSTGGMQSLLAALLLSLGIAHPLNAQSGAIVLFAHGGRINPVADLAEGTGDELGSGFSVGGGLTLMLGHSVALRGYVTRTRADYRGPTLTVQDSSITRTFYGGDLMIGWATESGFAPYLFGGAGGVVIDPADGSLRSFTRFVVRAGAGFNYLIERSPVTPFVEGGFSFYSFDRLGFDRRQSDFTASIGIALAIPF